MNSTKTRITGIAIVAYCMILPILLYFTVEQLNLQGAVTKPGALLLAFIVIFIAVSFVNLLTGSLYASFTITGIALLVLYIVNFYRSRMSGFVFAPGDLSLLGRFGSIVGFTKIKIEPETVVVAIISLLLPLPLLFLRKHIKMSLRARMTVFCVAIILALTTFVNESSSDAILSVFDFEPILGQPANITYEENSVLVGFYLETIKSRAYRPEDYSETVMRDILYELRKKKEASKLKTSADKPNVIIIMSEAFTDPARWANIEFSQDPAPKLHALQNGAAYASGNIITPAFGGSTCNPEWEFLTGNFMVLNTGFDIPFQEFESYIPTDEMRSVPNQFKESGYSTLAIHPYLKDFFNRDRVYPRLGFDRFIGNTDMPDAPWKGYFITDDYVADIMLENVKKTEEPLFLFNVSMENHYNYDPSKFESTSVKIKDLSGNLSDYDIGVIETYLEGIHDADAALGKLIDGLEKIGEKTIVLFYGDHSPLLGNTALDVFNKQGTVSVDDFAQAPLDEFYFVFSTPYVIWANYELKPLELGDMSPAFAASKLMELAGIEQNIYFNFLNESYKSLHGYKEGLFVDSDDSIHKTVPENDRKVIDWLFLIQYDMLYGKQYIKQELAAFE